MYPGDGGLGMAGAAAAGGSRSLPNPTIEAENVGGPAELTAPDVEPATECLSAPARTPDNKPDNRIVALAKSATASFRRRPRAWLWATAALGVCVVASGIVALVMPREAPRVVELDLGGPIVYHDFPDVIADLKYAGRTPRHVKLGIVVELPEDLRPALEAGQTEIVDTLHSYLREQTREDLTGEAGASKVRAELTALIEAKIAPGHVKSVLFRQFILN